MSEDQPTESFKLPPDRVRASCHDVCYHAELSLLGSEAMAASRENGDADSVPAEPLNVLDSDILELWLNRTVLGPYYWPMLSDVLICHGHELTPPKPPLPWKELPEGKSDEPERVSSQHGMTILGCSPRTRLPAARGRRRHKFRLLSGGACLRW